MRATMGRTTIGGAEPGTRVAPRHALVLLAAAVGATAQEPPRRAELVAGFRRLPAAAQAEAVGRIERRLQDDADPVRLRIAALAAGLAPPPAAPVPTFHDPKEFAPVAPARTLVTPELALHKTVAAQFPPPPFLRDLHAAVRYDWAAGQPVRANAPPTVLDRFEDLAAGFPPGADAAVAAILAEIDRDGDQRQIAVWLERLYADRDGRVFAGIRLYDAWYSGRTVEVPDVDAIAFARRILHTESFVSPIPGDRRRDRLYRQIKDAFALHREYRTLRQAAAATFVTASPDLDPLYQPLVPRLQLLWGLCGFDAAQLARRLDDGDRAALLESLDEALGDERNQELRYSVRDALEAAARSARRVCAEELARAAGR
jgi:hypothetical protein